MNKQDSKEPENLTEVQKEMIKNLSEKYIEQENEIIRRYQKKYFLLMGAGAILGVGIAFLVYMRAKSSIPAALGIISFQITLAIITSVYPGKMNH